MKKYFYSILILFISTNILGQKNMEMPLYDSIVPNSIKATVGEKTILVNGTRRIYTVVKPTLTVFFPKHPNGKSVIICPGGGYQRLSIDNEGVFVAKELNKLVITAFVLKYRLPNDTIMIDKTIGPLQDAQQAIRIVRKNAVEWKLDKKQVGIMGFSAGGHLASTAATHFNFTAERTINDSISVRPDFAILIYPVISFADSIAHQGSRDRLIGKDAKKEMTELFSNELKVTKECPPVFIVHAGDDATVPVENSIRFYQACIKNKVQAEMHIYPAGGHGFGLENTTTKDKWIDRLANWIKTLK
ncbi:alpha/beta hydrolase [Ferruginibacter sp. SUN002]|uniref:alpha/beta hydrolase n=1 Tax=Ferruginibacter sp. SUN002 TaxID=2937789 RepID=UPI003D362745